MPPNARSSGIFLTATFQNFTEELISEPTRNILYRSIQLNYDHLICLVTHKECKYIASNNIKLKRDRMPRYGQTSTDKTDSCKLYW